MPENRKITATISVKIKFFISYLLEVGLLDNYVALSIVKRYAKSYRCYIITINTVRYLHEYNMGGRKDYDDADECKYHKGELC